MLSFKFKQVADWPLDLIYAGAVLRDNPDQLAVRHGIPFTQGQDDLDVFDAAVIEISPDNWIVLIRYPRSPLPGTTVMLDRDLTKAHAAWSAFKECFGVTDAEWVTVAPELASRWH